MHIVKTFGHLVGGTLLVAGTSIGVGMLALPVATAAGGFIPSMFIYALCWVFMLCTGLLILEACIWMPKDANLITLSSRLLGKWGKVFCWILYLFLFSCLMVAHIAGGGSVVSLLSNGSLPVWLSTIIYVAIFAPVVYFGTLWVDRLNLLLMVGIVITYLVFVGSSAKYIDFNLLARMDWGKSWLALPVVFTAFGYQSLIPTLFNYMNRNVKKMRLAIIFGTAIPFLIYVIWEMLILGIVPLEGSGGLADAIAKGENAVNPLGSYLHNPTLLAIGQGFAFFAMTTSFLGISIAFIDFLADGLKVIKKGTKKMSLCALIFVVPMIITFVDPHLFLTALGYAGGFGVALLLGAMPVMMVWAGRYYEGHSLLHQQLPGGKITLSILMAFVLLEVATTLLA
jgi:tyrosine-specific transport protein